MSYLLAVVFFVVMSAFFSGIETALITSNPLKIYGKMKKDRRSRQIIELFNKMDKVINTILVGNNFSVVSAAIFFSFFFQQWYSFTKAMVLSTFILTLFMLLFCEIIPKTFSLRHATRIVMRFYPLLRFFMLLFTLVVAFLGLINRFILGRKDQERNFISREEVEFLFYKEKPTENYEDEKDFIYRVLNLSKVKLKEIKIPLNEVSAVSLKAQREEVLSKLREQYFSRFPVYEGDIFNFVGYIPIKEFLFHENKGVADLLKPTLFFPETKLASEALFEMQKSRKPLAFLVDEYGAVSGIVTKEDMVELIVGNIEDEIHREDAIIPIKGGVIVPGWEDVDHLNMLFSLGIEKDDFDTLSGFVAYKLGKIPEVGDHFDFKGAHYWVLQVHNRIAAKIKITGGGFL